MDAIKLFSKQGAESTFSFIAVYTSSACTDTRAKLDPSNPEERQYYAFYLSDDEAIGLQSDIITIVVP